MPVTRESSIVDFDADAAVAVAKEVAGSDLRAAAEFDADDYRLLYVADRMLERYGGEGPVQEAASRLHDHIHLDFVERELYEAIAGEAGSLETYVTRMEHHTFVRHLVGREGLFLSLETGTELEPLLDRIDEVVDDAGEE